MNLSRESAAREQWMLDTVREIADKFAHDRDQGKVRSMLYPIIARHYAAREREEWIPVSERLPRASGEYEAWVDGTFESGGVPHAICPFPFYSKCCKFREDVTHWRPLPAAPFAAKGETDSVAAQGEQHEQSTRVE